MVHINHQQNNFSSGIIQPDYLGRADLNLYANGLKDLQNMDILPSGALKKRQGTKNISRFGNSKSKDSEYTARLETYIGNDGRNFLLVFESGAVHVLEVKENEITNLGNIVGVAPYIRSLDDIKTSWQEDPYDVTIFWNNSNLQEMTITKGENYFIICHADNKPVLLFYTPYEEDTNGDKVAKSLPFTLHHWSANITETGRYRIPYSRFDSAKTAKLQLIEKTIDGYVSHFLLSDTDLFDKSWKGAAIRLLDNGGKEVDVLEYVSAKEVKCEIVGVTGTAAIKGTATAEWSEAIFSNARGWPSCATFHQGRLVFGATRSFPKSIWMSKSGDYHDFAIGENSDDAIDITLATTEAGKIQHFLSAKHLQIFTASSEWVITDEVITPSQITLQKRTNIGSYESSSLAPLLLNGSSLFFDKQGQLHEYTYANLEDSYVVNNLSRLTEKQGAPVNMVYDSHSRRLFCPWENGDIKILNLYSAEKITAWTHYKTKNAKFIDLASLQGRLFALCFRYFDCNGNHYFSCYLEEFSDEAKRDGQTSLTESNNQKYIETALQLDGKITLDTGEKEVGLYNASDLIINDSPLIANAKPADKTLSKINGTYLNRQLQQAGIDTNNSLVAGIPIEVTVQSLTPRLTGQGTHNRYRLLDAVFHLGDAEEFEIDIDPGSRKFNQQSLAFLDSTNAGKDKVQSLKITGGGWSNDSENLIWKINFTNRSDFTLYGVEMRLSIH